ncbi:glycosyltransferase family 2 protein [Novosphingobium sp. Rr 2-17]|uniref:glycosyltransferase family 2 protein n=1 Tax=Novosphingobium sp. Rr 2-17 TaxID=555793 RepID=UPI00063FD06C|nr:glycosyltransferase family 2 protein [Novosphingobium sp. Rr 2-17]
MLDITVVILTFNEEIHIERAIESVRNICVDVLVVDSFSSDRTVELAKAAGARVLQNEFVNQSKQFQWALDHGFVESSWIMRLDADEIIEPDLVEEICREVPGFSNDIVGVCFDRKHIFMGRWIRYGGRFPVRLVRLWRRGYGRVEDRWMDEHVVVWGGKTVLLKGGFSDSNENDLTFFTDKHNKYATREAAQVLISRYNLFEDKTEVEIGRAPFQAILKRWLKVAIYNKMPFWAGPFLYFIYRYFFQFGFLDGKSGLIYHFLQGFWYRFLVASKIFEYELAFNTLSSTDERIEFLCRATNLKLRA